MKEEEVKRIVINILTEQGELSESNILTIVSLPQSMLGEILGSLVDEGRINCRKIENMSFYSLP
jgi:predicted transcriptional regulator